MNEKENKFYIKRQSGAKSLTKEKLKEIRRIVDRSLPRINENIEKAEKNLSFFKKINSLGNSFVIEKTKIEKPEFVSKETVEEFFPEIKTEENIIKSSIGQSSLNRRARIEKITSREIKKTPLKSNKFPKDFFQP